MTTNQEMMTVETKDQIAKMSDVDLVAKYGQGKKSVTIRYLAAIGFSRSQIAKMLNIRYQHVRNTLTEPMKKVD